MRHGNRRIGSVFKNMRHLSGEILAMRAGFQIDLGSGALGFDREMGRALKKTRVLAEGDEDAVSDFKTTRSGTMPPFAANSLRARRL
jgi:hypothetical protein